MPAFTTARKNMALGQLITNEVQDARVLDAMTSVPREEFVPEGLRGAAYADEDLLLPGGRFLIDPGVLARMLAACELTPGSNVLVIGAAPGYVPAVLAQMVARVLGTEESEQLADEANTNLQRLGLWHAKIAPVKDLAAGNADEGPYDLIFINGAVEEIQESLFAQLRENGVMLCVHRVSARPDSASGLGKALLIRRRENNMEPHELFDASIPLLPAFARRPGFVL